MKKIYTILALFILASVAVPAPAVVTVAFMAEEWRGPRTCGDPIGTCMLDPNPTPVSQP